MLIGYLRVSKADGSQVLDLQRDALLAAGIETGHLYEDMASGKRDDPPNPTAATAGLPIGYTAVGTTWVASKPRGLNMSEWLQPRNQCSYRSRGTGDGGVPTQLVTYDFTLYKF